MPLQKLLIVGLQVLLGLAVVLALAILGLIPHMGELLRLHV
jgi:hypothetical protein